MHDWRTPRKIRVRYAIAQWREPPPTCLDDHSPPQPPYLADVDVAHVCPTLETEHGALGRAYARQATFTEAAWLEEEVGVTRLCESFVIW